MFSSGLLVQYCKSYKWPSLTFVPASAGHVLAASLFLPENSKKPHDLVRDQGAGASNPLFDHFISEQLHASQV